ncbi:YheT family hydrolase [Marinigracilibium pacificum]|uniref:Alpha/beta fold hydrolase n=1 Tax=Marinigracilibium pacificum TaxID=2729599 RepID=A0A848J0X8_9BACT|nr:alpha/beta fold hydrolase [Marinigracilibium pacificum]NMM50217.1 alpha/beta fold hydrolase [Marinigracilibium pacificum]
MQYKAPKIYFSSHIETILPSLLRKVKDVNYQRERIETPDNDFLDLDWLRAENNNLVVICHGLEGSSDRPYVKGMARALHMNGLDILAWNYRGCSGEMNRNLRFYHSGATDDLDLVINHGLKLGYESVILIGFSLGGNLVLKYCGENGSEINSKVKKVIAFSVPLDLAAGSKKISESSNFIYERRFLNNLELKVAEKSRLMPDKLTTDHFQKIKTLYDFDDHYTAPIHGFKNAKDYYQKCSSINYVSSINIPALIVNAKNDPFLPEECYPKELLERNENIVFEFPEKGGHVGFTEFNKERIYWSEKRALKFIKE